MTDKKLGWVDNAFIGYVTNVKDPDQSGRVQIRTFGYNDDKTNIKDEHLPWGLPKQSVRSAAQGHFGESPLGLLVGSKVYGHFIDADRQILMIDGSFGKSGDPVGTATVGNKEQIDRTKGSIPMGSQDPVDGQDPEPRNPGSKLYDRRYTIDDWNDPTKQALIEKEGWPAANTGPINSEEVNKKLKQPDVPTTASASKTDKSDIADIIRRVDPQNLGASLPNMVANFSYIRDVMSMFSAIGQTNMLTSIISMAAQLIGPQLGIQQLMAGLIGLMRSGELAAIQYSAIANAIVTLDQLVVVNQNKIPKIEPHIPQINPEYPTPRPIVIDPPAHYVQVYYLKDTDPYPGYIEWVDENSGTKVYTLRGDQPLFASPLEHSVYVGAMNLKPLLSTLCAQITLPNGALSITLQAPQITAALNGLNMALNSAQMQAVASVLGGGITLTNIISQASNIIPQLASGIEQIANGHLPTSIFPNGGSAVNETMQQYTKNQALLKKKKDKAKRALEPKTDDQDDALKKYADQTALDDLKKFSPTTPPYEHHWPLAGT